MIILRPPFLPKPSGVVSRIETPACALAMALGDGWMEYCRLGEENMRVPDLYSCTGATLSAPLHRGCLCGCLPYVGLDGMELITGHHFVCASRAKRVRWRKYSGFVGINIVTVIGGDLIKRKRDITAAEDIGVVQASRVTVSKRAFSPRAPLNSEQLNASDDDRSRFSPVAPRPSTRAECSTVTRAAPNHL